MKERPILFSAPMVRALRAGKKTQTRRIAVKDQLHDWQLCNEDDLNGWRANGAIFEADSFYVYCEQNQFPQRLKNPYGVAGDRLWVREAWRASHKYDAAKPSEIADPAASVMYECDGTYRNWDHLRAGRYRHARFMPRWASRTIRAIVAVKPERLLDISENDAIAEGLSCVTKDGTLYKYGIPDRDGLPGTDDDGWPWTEWDIDPRIAYFKLWNKINGAGAASKNPWVWAVTMKDVA